MSTRSSESIVILGRTIAGLTAARDLACLGWAVTLLDHPAWQPDPPETEYLLGCHTHTWALLQSLPKQTSAPTDHRLPLEFRIPNGAIVSYRPTTLPGSLHWIAGLLRFRGLSWQDRWALLSYLERVWEHDAFLPTVLEPGSAEVWLAAIGQSPAARETIWSPLARFLTGTPLPALPAATFAQMLAQPFLSTAGAAAITRLGGSMTERILTPLTEAATQAGVTIIPLEAPPHIHFDHHAITHIRIETGRHIQATWYLSAISYRPLLSLLPDRLLTRYAYFSHLGDLTSQEQVVVEVSGPSLERAPRLILLPSPPCSYLDVVPAGHGVMHYRVVLLGEGLAKERDDVILAQASHELETCFPAIPIQTFTGLTVRRQAQTRLSLKTGTAMARPIQRSPIQNLLLAGGWTDTGWPDNLESEVVSTHQCVAHMTGTPR